MTTLFCFLTATAACVIVGGVVGVRWDRRDSVGIAAACSLLAASWFQIEWLGTPLNVQIAVATVMMLAFCFHSGRRILSPIGILDVLMAAMVLWHIVADTMQQGFSGVLPLRAYGEWALPYVTGRFAVTHHGAIGRLAPFFAIASVVLGLAAVFESLTGVNLWESLFVPVDDVVTFRRGKRWELAYRAMGPTRHPIFLAVVLLLCVPWVVAWWETSQSSRYLRSRLAGLLAVGLGVLATVSRGPVIAAAAATAVLACYISRAARWVLIGAGVLGIIAASLNFDRVVGLLEMAEGQRRGVFELDDEVIVYSGTRNRLLVVQVYTPLIVKGGVFGYGTEATSTFPPNIPGLPKNAETRERLGIVDNAFVLIGLRFGWLGLGLFIGLFVAAIWKSFAMAPTASTYFFPVGDKFFLALGWSLVAVSVEVLTVYCAYDFTYWLLLTFGVVAGLDTRRKLVLSGRSE